MPPGVGANAGTRENDVAGRTVRRRPPRGWERTGQALGLAEESFSISGRSNTFVGVPYATSGTNRRPIARRSAVGPPLVASLQPLEYQHTGNHARHEAERSGSSAT